LSRNKSSGKRKKEEVLSRNEGLRKKRQLVGVWLLVGRQIQDLGQQGS
jgi:hypothetical protein